MLHIDGLTATTVRQLSDQHCHLAGDAAALVGDSGRIWAAVTLSNPTLLPSFPFTPLHFRPFNPFNDFLCCHDHHWLQRCLNGTHDLFSSSRPPAIYFPARGVISISRGVISISVERSKTVFPSCHCLTGSEESQRQLSAHSRLCRPPGVSPHGCCPRLLVLPLPGSGAHSSGGGSLTLAGGRGR